MKPKFVDYYMSIAQLTSTLSSAIRRQVGAVIVKGNKILATGYNGMPTGWTNECEHKEYMDPAAGGWLHPDEIEYQWPLVDTNGRYKLVTKDEVLHAESNALAKVSSSTESSEGATLFVTTAPCVHCAKMIYQSGISSLFYRDTYHDSAGIDFLEKSGVIVTQHPIQN